MMKRIIYDFALSDQCISSMEQTAEMLTSRIVNKAQDTAELLSGAINCHATPILFDRYECFCNKTAKIRDEILMCAEEIRSLSLRIHLAEEEAERLAALRTTGD